MNNNYQISKWSNLWNKITFNWDLNKVNTDYYFVIDVSHWEYDPLKFSKLKFSEFVEEKKVKGLILKVCDAWNGKPFYDDGAEWFYNLAQDYRLLTTGYAFIQPSVDPTVFHNFYDNWKKDHPFSLPDSVDFEVKEFGRASDILWRLKTFLSLGKPDSIIYTSIGYINTLMMGMTSEEIIEKFGWLKSWDLWIAWYSRYAPKKLWPWGDMDWKGWQYSANADFPHYLDKDNINASNWGFPGLGLDVNWFKQSYLQPYLDKMNGNGEIIDVSDLPYVPPPIIVEAKTESAYKVLIDNLNIRTGPGIRFPSIGKKNKGDIVEAINIGGSNSWIEILPGKWVCYNLNNKQYLLKEN